ncbi:hypothetical protein CMQ_5552 [Grosmannia clavigera kw1407]|uniref:Uncharacterized protein n=1 Tax=Grosmannia clavigera (strain kw1407 / UAMH 11150) TaxID=655863 RepID=F0XSR6_GROCL|nr:uncharacterized protein CMQ_5552 [Grosmannia clavigera kw1407]EFW99131.1 hypothetical protein CMQ_5552 [Grosmannia clavigera kw1407]
MVRVSETQIDGQTIGQQDGMRRLGRNEQRPGVRTTRATMPEAACKRPEHGKGPLARPEVVQQRDERPFATDCPVEPANAVGITQEDGGKIQDTLCDLYDWPEMAESLAPVPE